jgi:hypothetical protein
VISSIVSPNDTHPFSRRELYDALNMKKLQVILREAAISTREDAVRTREAAVDTRKTTVNTNNRYGVNDNTSLGPLLNSTGYPRL